MADTKEFLIRIITDAQAAAKTKADVDGVKRQLLSLEETAKQVGSSLGSLQRTAKIDDLGRQFGAMSVKIDDTSEAARRLSIALKAVDATAAETARATTAFFNSRQAAQEATGGAAGGTRGSALRLLGSQGRALPSIMTPLGIGTDQISNIVRMAGAIGDLSEKAGISTQSLALMGGAAAALGVALLLAKRQFDEAKKAADADIAGREKAIDLILQGSKEDQQARINELEQKKQANKVQLDLAKDLLEKLRAQFIQANGGGVEGLKALGIAELGAQVGLGGAQFKSAEDAVTKYTNAVGESSTELDILTANTGLSAQSAADLAKKEAELAAERHKILFENSDITNKLTADIEAYNLAQNGSSDALQKRRVSLTTELQLTQNAIDAARYKLETEKLSQNEQNALAETINQLTQKQNALQTSLQAVSQSFVDVAIKARETAEKNIKDSAAAQKTLDKVAADAAADDEKRAADIEAINTKVGESYRKLADAYKQAGLEQAIKDKEADAKTARTRADEDAKTLRLREDKKKEVEADAEAKRTDALATAAQKRNDLLEKIENEYTLSSKQAIQERNAVALDAANQKRDKDKAEALKGYDEAKAQADKDRKERLDALSKDLEAQDRETRIARQNQDRETAIARKQDSDARRRKYLEDQNQLAAAQRAEIAQRNNAYLRQISDLNTFLGTQIKSQAGYYGDILSYATKLKSELNRILGGSGGSSSPVGGLTPATKIPPKLPGGRYVPEFDTGGRVGRSGHAWVDKDELILTPQQQKQMGGFTFAPVINGTSRSAIRAEVVTQLDHMLDEMGAA